MIQIALSIQPKPRGFHIITEEVLAQLPELPSKGLLHLFIQHTSAGICINENADPTVLKDLNNWFNRNVKENEPYYQHTFEGPDDMPAHLRAAFTRTTETVPIRSGQMALGIWQGIYLWEHRRRPNNRRIIVHVTGE